jgi:hypothetical protein
MRTPPGVDGIDLYYAAWALVEGKQLKSYNLSRDQLRRSKAALAWLWGMTIAAFHDRKKLTEKKRKRRKRA